MGQIYATKDPGITEREKKHMALARKLAGECVVLLENDGTLPLAKGGKLALFGNGARFTVKGGTGSGDVNTRSSVTIEQGLKEAGYTITTKGWMDRYDAAYKKAKQEYLSWLARESAQKGVSELMLSFAHPFSPIPPVDISDADFKEGGTDTAVYVLARNSGEGADRWDKEGDYRLFPQEKEQLAQLGRHYKNVVLVLNIGGVMDLSEVKKIPGIGAVLLLAQLGNITGNVLADVLTGEVNPSGKLTDTWAKAYGDYPSSEAFSHNDGNVDDEYYTEGIYVGYRYFDTFGVEPLYCFGYGKSYTDFRIEAKGAAVEEENVTVTADVTNVGGRYAGKEVVQVYYSAPAGDLDKPSQELAAFTKTRLLAPGETETLSISFALKDMASYQQQGAVWVLEAGDYVIRVGNSSRNTETAAVIRLSGRVETEHLKNVFADTHPLQEIRPEVAKSVAIGRKTLPADTPVILEVDASQILQETAVYTKKRQEYRTAQKKTLTVQDVKDGICTVEELAAQMSVEELADYCVGALRYDGGSIVGNASYMVPGAAGDTSSIAKTSRGIKNMILADGPAGLRLQPVFKTDKDGRLLPGGEILGDVYQPFAKDLNEDNSDTYYQYCTAIPIGWALAQSWNMDMLFEIGDMVGEEMELFGVDLWLAPALNIHRNPLCGRNFEYYSEDPYISGKAAAAITKGVQRHKGKGTTIKHFAVNSQEDNRYFTNSHVSERALREIYLKGFEIAVKESAPLSIMTSYNLINGIHAANHYDLLQTVARDEWGYQGMVMTDWYTSQEQPGLTGTQEVIYPISSSVGCVYAGNDIQMPGCQKNVDDIVEAVKSGKKTDGFSISLADLQFCAANVIRAAVETA